MGIKSVLALLLLVGSYSVERSWAEAPNDAGASEVRARLSTQKAYAAQDFLFSPLRLEDGSKLTLVSPTAWAPLSNQLAKSLSNTHKKFTELLGPIPPLEISIHLMEEEEFYLKTKAPRWTNAMYYKSKIIIPISTKEPVNYDNLYRSVKHEYVHAIVHSVSGGACPGWLDEGLAQWAEGAENPALRPALLRWLKQHEPVPLVMLQGGYTKLEMRIVPAAYAQSLFMTNTMINTFGFKIIAGYFERLRNEDSKELAFSKSFQLTPASFEGKIASLLKRWAKGKSDSSVG